MVETTENNNFRLTVTYKFEKELRKNGTQGSAARIKRLAQEFATLPTSLPVSFSSSVFVRADTDRLDIMKVLITGPQNTPYENGCFVFDVYFPPQYPNVPPLVLLETTGRGTVRFNPNLYACGKVCLSLLNTWSGRPEEKWSPKTSSFLQVLISIQSLIFVDDPYFNEPGYQGMQGTLSGIKESKKYNEGLHPNTVYWAMYDQLVNPSPCFRDVIEKHFWLKRNMIFEQIDRWNAEQKSAFLKNYKAFLADHYLKMNPPQGLEAFDIDTPHLNKTVLEQISKEKVQSQVVQPTVPLQNVVALPSFNSLTNIKTNKYMFPAPFGL